jgi:IS30 family transposase
MLLRSITWDQGSEMARHLEITEATGAKVYFCDAGSP